MRVTIVLPFFDEEALIPSVPGLLGRLEEVLAGHEVRFLAVDDGSRDGTAEGLGSVGGLQVVTHERNRGVGAAMASGLNAAAGDVALVYDPDQAYAPEAVGELVRAVEDADLSTLSPYHPDGGVEGVPAIRLFLSRSASRLYRRVLGSGLHTFTCAVRAYRLDAVRPLLPCPEDFTAAAWLLASALRSGLRVVEVPAVLRRRSGGRSKMRLLRAIRAHLRLLHDLSVTARRSNAGSS